MKFKELIRKSFPGSILSKYVDTQKHPILKFCFAVLVCVAVVCGVGILNGSGRYSHPFQKHALIHNSRINAKPSQKKSLRKFTKEENGMVTAKYYKLHYSEKANTVTMTLGSSAQREIDKANAGNQLYQEQITDVLFGQINQSKQMSQNAKDKKVGFIMMSKDGTILSFVRNGQVKYSVLPALSTVK